MEEGKDIGHEEGKDIGHGGGKGYWGWRLERILGMEEGKDIGDGGGKGYWAWRRERILGMEEGKDIGDGAGKKHTGIQMLIHPLVFYCTRIVRTPQTPSPGADTETMQSNTL